MSDEFDGLTVDQEGLSDEAVDATLDAAGGGVVGEVAEGPLGVGDWRVDLLPTGVLAKRRARRARRRAVAAGALLVLVLAGVQSLQVFRVMEATTSLEGVQQEQELLRDEQAELEPVAEQRAALDRVLGDVEDLLGARVDVHRVLEEVVDAVPDATVGTLQVQAHPEGMAADFDTGSDPRGVLQVGLEVPGELAPEVVDALRGLDGLDEVDDVLATTVSVEREQPELPGGEDDGEEADPPAAAPDGVSVASVEAVATITPAAYSALTLQLVDELSLSAPAAADVDPGGDGDDEGEDAS